MKRRDGRVLKRNRVWIEDDVDCVVVVVGVGWTIWAFCLRTSAGVRIRQLMSSAREEDSACVAGRGREETQVVRKWLVAS